MQIFRTIVQALAQALCLPAWRWAAFIGLLMQGFAVGSLYAAPVLDLQSQDRARMEIDLRTVWQTAMVPGQGADTSKPLAAQTVWDWPPEQFAPGKATPVMVRNGDRLIGRLSVQVQSSAHSMIVEVGMPRLDVIHLSYRYNNGPWVAASAGDQIPMARWPFANRYPVFTIPPQAGELQLVVDIPQQGLFPAPVVLWGELAFLEEHGVRNMEAGTALALAFVSTLICFGAVAIFKRHAFFAVGVYSISVLLMMAGQGGITGMYFGTTTTWFNDYNKYLAAMVFAAIVPWTVSAVMSQKYYAKFFARLATAWMVIGLLAIFTMLWTTPRAVQWAILSPFLIVSLLFAAGICLGGVARGYTHAYLSLAAVVLLCAGIFAPIAAYWGYLDGKWSFSITALSFWMSSPLLLFALLMQYRHGIRVVARAAYSANRDALTGLLNRAGFEFKLGHMVADITAHKSHALFVYIAVADAETLQERFGGEGFESGMVQMAAAISSSISVMDIIARVASNTFAIAVAMPHDAKLADSLAQKITTRIMAITSHSVPMAQTARMALAWMPVYGRQLADLEKLSKDVLHKMEPGKRIAWVGGAQAHADVADASQGHSSLGDERSTEQRNLDLHSVINRLERNLEQEEQAELQAAQAKAGRSMKIFVSSTQQPSAAEVKS
jgi:GGDEF domain-containing protein